MIETKITEVMATNPPKDDEGHMDYAFRVCMGVFNEHANIPNSQTELHNKAGEMVVRQTEFLLSEKPMVLDLVKSMVNGFMIAHRSIPGEKNTTDIIECAEQIASQCRERGLLP